MNAIDKNKFGDFHIDSSNTNHNHYPYHCPQHRLSASSSASLSVSSHSSSRFLHSRHAQASLHSNLLTTQGHLSLQIVQSHAINVSTYKIEKQHSLLVEGDAQKNIESSISGYEFH